MDYEEIMTGESKMLRISKNLGQSVLEGILGLGLIYTSQHVPAELKEVTNCLGWMGLVYAGARSQCSFFNTLGEAIIKTAQTDKDIIDFKKSKIIQYE